jgi:hypothetical protein
VGGGSLRSQRQKDQRKSFGQFAYGAENVASNAAQSEMKICFDEPREKYRQKDQRNSGDV